MHHKISSLSMLLFSLLYRHERITFDPPTNFSYYWADVIRGFTIWNPGAFANFDVRFNNPGFSDTTSYADNGYYTFVTVDNDIFTNLLGHDYGTKVIKKVNFSTKLSQPIGPDYLLIEYIVRNEDSNPHTVKIGTYCDIQLAKDDYASLYPIITDGVVRGLWMKSDKVDPRWHPQPSNLSLALIIRNGYGVRNVDTFWYGDFLDYQAKLVTKDNFLVEKTSYENQTGKDSVFVFGWKDTDIYPGETLSFGFLIGYSQQIKYPAIIKLNKELPTNNLPNTVVDVDVNVRNGNIYQDHLTLKYKFINANNQTEIKVVETFDIQYTRDVKFKVKLGPNVNKHTLEIWAEDDHNLSSNVIVKDLLVNQIPRLTILNTINDKYYTGGIVEVQGRLWDDSFASITYQFDDGYRYDADTPIQCNGAEIPFRKSFNLKEMSYGPHTLHIWATDEFGVKSIIYSFNFTYVELHAPEVELYPFETENRHYNDYVEINGKVRDIDYDDTVTLEYLPENDDPLSSFIEFDTKHSKGDWQNFTLRILIPPSTTNGTKYIIIRAKDQNGAISPFAYYNYTFVLRSVTPAATPSNFEPLPTSLPPDYTGPKTVTSTSTWIYTDTTDVNGNPSKTWIKTNTAITISTESGVSLNEGDAAAIAQSGIKKKNEKDKSLWLIVGIAAGVAALVALIAIAIIIHEARKQPAEFNPEDVENLGNDADGLEVMNDNPIYDKNAVDDPFANEFEDQANDNPAYV